MKTLVLVLLCMLPLGCGSASTGSNSGESANTAPSSLSGKTTPTESGVMVTISGSEVRGEDFIIKGVTPRNVENRMVTFQSNLEMAVVSTTMEGWIRVTAVDTSPIEGKYLWIPASQNASVEVSIIQLINKDYQPAVGTVLAQFEAAR
jgi:hypothetical protein